MSREGSVGASEGGSDSESEVGSIDERDLEDATLPEPEPVQIKVSTLYRRYRNGLINLNPYYQRDVVWPAARQSGLINSIFNNYYIPPVIFQCRKEVNPSTPNARPTLYQTAIDGKQRLSSILQFMAGQIPYKDPRGVTWWYPVQEAKNRKGRILTQELKDKFDNWSLLCIEYMGLKQKQEEDLFARVQQGMALSNFEKQMASHTPWTRLIKEVIKSYKLVAEICVDLKRGKDFGNVANVIAMMHYYDAKPESEPLSLRVSQSAVSKLINTMDFGPPSTKFAGRVRLVFKTWNDLYNKSPQTFSNEWNSKRLKKFSPIEFIATGILLHMYLDEKENGELIHDISQMRKYIRSSQVGIIDLRTNTQTWPCFWTFISGLERSGKKAKISRPVPAAVELPPHLIGVQVPTEQLILSSGPLSVSDPKTTQKKKAAAPQAVQEEATPATLEKARDGKGTKRSARTAALDVGRETKEDQQQPKKTPATKKVLPPAPKSVDVEASEKPATTTTTTTPTVTSPMGQVNQTAAGGSFMGYPNGFTPELMQLWQQAQAQTQALMMQQMAAQQQNQQNSETQQQSPFPQFFPPPFWTTPNQTSSPSSNTTNPQQQQQQQQFPGMFPGFGGMFGMNPWQMQQNQAVTSSPAPSHQTTEAAPSSKKKKQSRSSGGDKGK